MKKDKKIYWSATIIISLIMLFSIYKMYTPLYEHLGFPSYFRTELLVAKILGLTVLVVPQFSLRVKEWAYAGFGIVLISASVAHFNSGDAIANVFEPYIWLAILIISNIYLHKVRGAKPAAK
ncbi:DoxX family protein [Mucilaginibacter sp.]|jgi:hypothetical protein|uniref:DoxX family protein n=1 Tax=Mucilaginibacter sp. TaxID=1882438 RepID=UPI002C513214|nr:DoxX family protein [Mucilaginibacter sp.]HTI57926.1 DoxX family protein [Mucilaginibacter sp.]